MGDADWSVWTGSVLCPECGRSHVSRLEPSRLERFSYRLRFGMRLDPRMSCANGHEWRAAIEARTVLQRPRLVARLIRTPLAIIHRVRHGRRMTPVPLAYLLAAGLGLVVGLAADVALGWSWWLVAVGILIVVWALFVSTAFWGPFRLTRDDLYETIAPQRAVDRTMNQLAAAVASGSQVVYGVTDWPHQTSLAGWGGRTGQHTSVSLGYQGVGGRVTVKTSKRLDDRLVDLHMENLAENLLGAAEQPPLGLVGEELHDWLAGFRFRINKRLLMVEWLRESFLVAGAEVPADWLRVGESTAVFVRLEDHDIMIQSHGIDLTGMGLARVDSLPLG